VFFGSLSGNGVSGGGNVFIEGDARPGFSAGTMEFGGAVSLGPLALLELELGGTGPGVGHDRLAVAGHLALGGTLELTLIDGFVPQPGMVFDLWDAGSVSGDFGTVVLPELPPGSHWHTAELASTGELRVGATPESYPEFAALHALTTPPGGDQDGDGRSNLFEYFSGHDPNQPDQVGPLLGYRRVGEDDELSFLAANPAGSDLVVDLETTTTLLDGGPGAWSVIETRTGNGPWTGAAGEVRAVPAGAGRERVTVTHPTPEGIARFYRLRLRLSP
jgi:hypothetical protein